MIKIGRGKKARAAQAAAAAGTDDKTGLSEKSLSCSNVGDDSSEKKKLLFPSQKKKGILSRFRK